MDDMNDIRAVLGAIHNGQKHLIDKVERLSDTVDDYGALAVRSARLVELIEAMEEMISEVPQGLRNIASDPTFGMFIGEPLRELADDMEKGLADWRKRRTSPPSVEQG